MGLQTTRECCTIQSFTEGFRAEKYYTPEVELIIGFKVMPYILGNGGYTTTMWLVTPFRPRPGAPAYIQIYNDFLVQGRLVVEQVFGRLKARWWLLEQGIVSRIEWAPACIYASCILFNILLRNSDTLDLQGDYGKRDEEPPNEATTQPPPDYAEIVCEELASHVYLRRRSKVLE
ncbi:hypothetical protein R1sor_020361 [Riccia sorocarpa]|uniref:DDE Tnp4 domain-containing protein n=1 Tax=Riccia sorocarpa TaxID=122646 RepID=A0ABD3IGU7_9MARC